MSSVKKQEHCESGGKIRAKERRPKPIKTEREGSKDDNVSIKHDRWVWRETRMKDKVKVRQEDRENLYRKRKTERKYERERRGGGVSLTSATVIFTLYQCCADLCCREQTDSGHTTWLTSQGHLAWSINLALTRTHSHPYSYGASTNGTTVITTARCNRLAVSWLLIKCTASHWCKINHKEDGIS